MSVDQAAKQLRIRRHIAGPDAIDDALVRLALAMMADGWTA